MTTLKIIFVLLSNKTIFFAMFNEPILDQARGRQAVGARGPNLKLQISLRAAVLVLETFK